VSESSDWSIVFYREGDWSPVREFVESLDDKTKGRLRWSIEQLRQRNVSARQPLARHVEGKLWELREESNTNIYRVLYFTSRGRRIVLLHGFQKKTQRTPRREIETAQRRLVVFEAKEWL